jgi:hypothetical protein
MRRGSVHSRKLTAPAYMSGMKEATLIQAEVGGLCAIDFFGGAQHSGSAAMWAVQWGLCVDMVPIFSTYTCGNTPSTQVPGGLHIPVLLPRGWHSFCVVGMAGSDATWCFLAGATLSVKEI